VGIRKAAFRISHGSAADPKPSPAAPKMPQGTRHRVPGAAMEKAEARDIAAQ